MKNIIIGFLLGVAVTVAATAIAQTRSVEYIFNDVWTDATDTIKLIAQ